VNLKRFKYHLQEQDAALVAAIRCSIIMFVLPGRPMGCPATKNTGSPDLRRPASIAERSISAIISSVEAIEGGTIGKTPLATVS
jgi:hypothetical protein